MASNYARQMARLRKSIFKEVTRPTDKKSMKVVKIFSGLPPHLDPFVVDYYPRLKEMKQLTDGLRDHGLFKDEHEDFKDELRKRREARGKIKKLPAYIIRRREKEEQEAKGAGAAESTS